MKKLYSLFLFLPFFAQAQKIFTVAGGGTGGDGGPATAASLLSPYGVVIDDAGNLYIGDNGCWQIKKVTPAINGIITTVAGDGTYGYSYDGWAAVIASIRSATWVATGHDGSFYISDVHRLRKVTPDGIIRTIAGTGIAGYNGDNIQATAAQINVVCNVVVDDTGSVYFADAENLRIRKIDTSGIITTVAGTGATGFSADGSKADTSKFVIIRVLAIDKNNNLFFLEDNRIRKIDANTHIINTIAGTGIGGFGGDGGPATAAKIEGGGIAIDTSGNLYFTDNMRIRKVDKDGIITTIAGSGDFGFEGDGGDATAAKFRFPQMIAVNKEGDVFVSDVNSKRVRVITNKPLSIGKVREGMGVSIDIIPNPAVGKCTVMVNSPNREQAIIVMADINGREILRLNDYTNCAIVLPVHLPAGLYVVRVLIGKQQIAEQLIVR